MKVTGRRLKLAIGGIRILEGCIIVVTLGAFIPQWELRFLAWNLGVGEDVRQYFQRVEEATRGNGIQS